MRQILSQCLTYICCCLIQFCLGEYNTSKYFPNIALIVIIYIAFTKGALHAELFGFFFGITIDSLSIDIFGSKAITLTIIGYIFGKILIKFNKDQIITQCTIVFLASILYLAIIHSMYYISSSNRILNYPYYVILIATITTVAFTPIIFNILKKLG
ncbi:MAG: rod shape-determining protein MreD [Endomicrobium sp.]|jgi:rod shape-determining protein MreD|nr:rod shape-determining protein MreD [Endomicrobium sp.]